MIKSFVLSALFACAASAAHAGQVGPLSLTGKDLHVNQDPTVGRFVYVVGVAANMGCTQNNMPVLVEGNPAFKELFATLMLAKTNGKQVTITYTNCWSNYSTPKVDSVILHD